MALLPAGQLANIYASLDYYLQAKLGDDAGLQVQLHGVRRFVPPVDDAWVEAIYNFLGLQSVHRRQIYGLSTGQDVYGTERQGYLQLNIYQRARVFTQRYTLAAARDAVVAVLPEGHAIPVYDFQTQTTLPDTSAGLVGGVILYEISEDVVDTGERSGMLQHTVQVATRYLEHYTRPS